MKIQQHTELEVYRKSLDAAMLIFESVKGHFRKKRPIRLLIKSGAPHYPFVQILQKLGVSAGIRRLSLPNFATRKAKLRKLKSGSISQ
jgi:hypothetical protein